jgi:hypothetical protein
MDRILHFKKSLLRMLLLAPEFDHLNTISVYHQEQSAKNVINYISKKCYKHIDAQLSHYKRLTLPILKLLSSLTF